MPGHDAIVFNSESDCQRDEAAATDEVSFMDLGTQRQTVLGISGSMPRLLPGGPLLLVRDGAVMAARFDLDRLTDLVRPVTALEGLMVEGWIGQYAVASNGTMVYESGEWLLGNELVWDDGRGTSHRLISRCSPTATSSCRLTDSNLAITVGGGADSQVWVYDLERGARRLLTTDGDGGSGIWAPDGERIAYGAQRR